MGLIASEGVTEFERAPGGVHLARCYQLIDLGHQESAYNGVSSSKATVLIGWELLNECMADGRPFTVRKRYTVSLHENATLRKDLQGWRDKEFTEEELQGFHLSAILGHYCQLQVIHTEKNGKRHENVTTVMALSKGMPTPDGINKLQYFDFENFSQTDFNELSDGLKKIIQKSPEWQALQEPAAVTAPTAPLDFLEDDIPF